MGPQELSPSYMGPCPFRSLTGLLAGSLLLRDIFMDIGYRMAKLNSIRVRWPQGDLEEGSKRIPIVPLPPSDRGPAAWEEAVRTPSEESLAQCLDELPTLEEI